MSHSIKQKDYFAHKFIKFKDISALSDTAYMSIYQRIDPRTQVCYSKYYVWTLPHFSELRSIYYPDIAKKVPESLLDSIDAEALAY